MRLGWVTLLKRVFNLDLTHCPHCGGELRIIVAILQRQAIEKILNHFGTIHYFSPNSLVAKVAA
jgi:hypothetical protein